MKINHALVFSLLLLTALIIAGCSQTTSNTVSDGDTNVEEYSLAEVATHNTAEDCWLILDGKVYDVTEYISEAKYPGKEAILEGCGKESTTLYDTRPMGSGTPHSANARNILENHYIGTLK